MSIPVEKIKLPEVRYRVTFKDGKQSIVNSDVGKVYERKIADPNYRGLIVKVIRIR